ncbi:MAG: exodeoxyribonuclease VII large subunit [Burkholderiaceae bacterium]
MNIDFPISTAAPMPRIVSVGELVRQVASLLERSFPLSWVSGEISNLTRASSGHWYFSMKDRDAQVRCVMFRNRNQHVAWVPRDGDRIEARVLPGLYAPRGDFQLQVEQLRRAGAGVLFEAFLRIKAALEAEGLFDIDRKRALPRHPRVIGVVTSLQAAALRDVLATLARRAPHVEVLVFPTPVQGTDAPARIVEAIAAASHPRHAIDVLLVVRGGGSIEDLWAFNDEQVARAIANAAMPVVSGVGHETDFTIAGFVADVRAPTPTAAGELASPDAPALSMLLAQHRSALNRASVRLLNASSQRVDEAARRLRSPAQRLQLAQQRLDVVARRLMRAQSANVADAERSIDHAAVRLKSATRALRGVAGRPDALRERLFRSFEQRLRVAAQASLAARQRLALLDPKGVLQRGYAIATDAEGRVVRDATGVAIGATVSVEVAHGRFATRVVAVTDD